MEKNCSVTGCEYGTENFDFNNTGLRPNWNAFWSLEYDVSEPSGNIRHHSFKKISGHFLSPNPTCSRTTSGTDSRTRYGTCGLIEHIQFITGSEWIGECDTSGMSGLGLFKMPHGVVYEGTIEKGLFDGVGVLRYPNEGTLEGLWYKGQLKYWRYDYADGLEMGSTVWPYCCNHDRRFYSEILHGLRPASTEQESNHHPAREIPPGHYDVGMGFYNPKTKCVVSPVTGDVLSIPTQEEEKWILEKCRSSKPYESVAYCSNLYKNWSKEEPRQSQSNDNQKKSQKEILALLKQEGGTLEPIDKIIRSASSSLQAGLDKCEVMFIREEKENQPKIVDYEVYFRKALREMDNLRMKQGDESPSVKGESDSELDKRTSVIRLIKLINTFSGKIKKLIREENFMASRKKTDNSDYNPLELFRILGKLMRSSVSPIATKTSFSSQVNSLGKEQGELYGINDIDVREVEGYFFKSSRNINKYF